MVITSKRPRAPSFADKHPDYAEETRAATTIGADWFQEKGKDEGKLKTFLEQCGFCKKKLRHDEAVFMYGAATLGHSVQKRVEQNRWHAMSLLKNHKTL
ncbi:hypothetical protein Bca101_037267 [Brassica carinata]